MSALTLILITVPHLVFTAVVAVALGIGEAGQAVYEAVAPRAACHAPAQAGNEPDSTAKPSPSESCTKPTLPAEQPGQPGATL